MIFQGDIFWVDLSDPVASGPAGRRPMVVIQNDTANQSAIHTVIMCALTTNLSLGGAPGNVILDPGEGGTSRDSVVNVSQIYTVDKTELTDAAYIGFLSPARMADITAGVTLFL